MAGPVGPVKPNTENPEDTDFREDLEIEEPEDEPEVMEPEETDVERQARNMGWHPRSEYMGPPHKWVPAAEFIRRGENILPILRENHRKLQGDFSRQGERLNSLEMQLVEQTKMIQELREMAKSQNERGYQRARAEIEAEKRKAVGEGDVETYNRLDAQLQEVERGREKANTNPPPPPPAAAPKEDPAITAWKNENPWFMSDQVLNLAMQEAHIRLKTEQPGLALSDNLEQAKEEVMARYPQKFGLPPKPTGNGQRQTLRAPQVAQPSPAGRQPARKTASPIDQIEDADERAQARAAYGRYKRQMPDFTEDEYMQIYHDPKSDVLTKRRSGRENLRGRL